MGEEGSSGVQRVIDILIALGEVDDAQRRGLGVVELARSVGREKSQISRKLETLAESGLVDRDPDTHRYRLGWRFFALAARAGEEQLLAAAPPIMRGLVETTGERVHLTVLENGRALTVLSETPSRSVQTASLVSRTVPLQSTSCGRALLYDAEDAEIEALVREEQPEHPGSRASRTLPEFIARVRKDAPVGYSVSVDEFEEGLAAIAAPVRDFRGRIVAALNISGPKFRLHNKLRASGRQVRAAAGYLSENLGWSSDTDTLDQRRSS